LPLTFIIIKKDLMKGTTCLTRRSQWQIKERLASLPVAAMCQDSIRPSGPLLTAHCGKGTGSAIGWNKDSFWLVQVDGRQRRSIGMNLSELSKLLIDLGCTEGMNLDGGGSATLWYNGKVRNRPCDGEEREIANSLVVVQKQNPGGAGE
jgi:hypothetical protein